MEIPSLQGFTREKSGLMTMEKPLKKGEKHESLRIGIPREVANEERRVAIAPSGVVALVANGHDVYVEEDAGRQAHFRDDEYAEAGAKVVDNPGDLYARCDLIAKVGPPDGEELDYLRERQILISALNLGGTTAEFLHHLMRMKISGIGFEFIRDPDGTFPLVRMMHEITGSMAIQIAGRYLESNEGGKGVMLGGISGVPPATVVILGAGVVGEWAARTALGYGARARHRARQAPLARTLPRPAHHDRYGERAVHRAGGPVGRRGDRRDDV